MSQRKAAIRRKAAINPDINRRAVIARNSFSGMGPQPENGEDLYDFYIGLYSGLIGTTEADAKKEGYDDDGIDCAVISMLEKQKELAEQGRDPRSPALKTQLEALDALINDIPVPKSCGRKFLNAGKKIFHGVKSYFSRQGGRTKRSKRSKSRRTRRTRR